VRVIAGVAKGTRLGPVPAGTRPLSDRAREGFFSSLGEAVSGARVLDLYAGTGAMGIEALSRGAASAVFVDREHAAVSAVKSNLDKTGLAASAKVIKRSVRQYLRGKAAQAELVFLDPPYDTAADEVELVLEALTAGWLSPRAWTVVLTRPSKSYTPVTPVNWRLAKRLVYGDTLVVLFREV